MTEISEMPGGDRVIFSCEQRFRSSGVVVACIACIAGSALFAYAQVWQLSASESSWFLRHVFGIAALVSLMLGGRFLLGILRDERGRCEITTAGIREGSRRRISWNDISRLVAGGSASNKTVRLFYFRGTPRFNAICEILSAEPLTPADYERLIAALRTEVLPRFPHLQLGGYEPARNLSS